MDLRPAVFDRQAPSLDIAGLAQSLPERRDVGIKTGKVSSEMGGAARFRARLCGSFGSKRREVRRGAHLSC